MARHLLKDDEEALLSDAILWMDARLDKGVHCPCCGKFNKRYRRKLNRGIALSLIRMYRGYQYGWVDVSRAFPKSGREEGKLVWWGLAEENPDKKGTFRVTSRGVAWLKDTLHVPSHAIEYQGICERLDGDLIDVSWSLGEPFDYFELMTDRFGGV